MAQYETIGGVPTQGEAFARFLHHIREAQTQAALLSHLYRANDKSDLRAQGFLGIEELLRRMVLQTTKLAKGTFQ